MAWKLLTLRQQQHRGVDLCAALAQSETTSRGAAASTFETPIGLEKPFEALGGTA
jgi:hypothetical protein